MKAVKMRKPTYRMRLFLSYIAVLVVPMAFLFTQFFSRSTNSLRQELMRAEVSAADSYIGLFEKELSSCEEIARSFSYYQGLAPFQLNGNVSRAISLIGMLNRYEIGHRFFDNLYIQFDCDDYYYSSSSSITSKSFYQAYRYAGQEELTLRQAVENAALPTLCPNVEYLGSAYGARETGLMMICPYFWQNERQGTISFWIPQPAIEETLGNIDQGQRTLYLFTLSGESIGRRPNLPSLPALTETPVQTFEDHTILYGRLSGEAPFGFLCVSSQGVLEALRGHTSLYVLLLAVTLLSGLALCFLAAKSSYSPIRALRRVIDGGGEGNHDDLQYLQEAYLDLMGKNKQMQRNIQRGLQKQQRLMLSALLTGDIADDASFLRECEDMGLDLSGPIYWVILTTLDQEHIPGLLAHAGYPQALHLYPVGSKGVYLMETQTYGEQYAPVNGLYIAPPRTELWALPSTYAYARSMYDTRTLDPDHYLHLLSDLTQPYRSCISALSDSLERRDVPAFEAACADLLEKASGSMPVELRRQLYYHVACVLYEKRSDAAAMQTPPSFDALLGLDSASALTDYLKTQLDRQASALRKTYAHRRPALQLDSIIANIQAHYTLADFSLQTLAKEYDVSVSYISQFFKEHYGVGLLDYYTQLRMERAKELMRSTELNVADISFAVGYYRSSSFSRRFKQLYGITPAEYKKSCCPESGAPSGN